MLPFEKPAYDLEVKIEELKGLSSGGGELNIEEEVARLEGKLEKVLIDIYGKLSPWEKVLLSRHALRPHALNYIESLFEDVVFLGGDRVFGEDASIVSGFARFRGHGIVFIGQEKGHDVESRVKHNFGMPKPEGYRKVIRMMRLASRFGLPIVTLVDTAGAYPGAEAEARGQAEAIAQSLLVSLEVGVPYISVVIGEGGSGGAIAISVADRLMMLEHSYYSVISPEGASSILWRESGAETVSQAASSLSLTAQDWDNLGIVDEVIKEPVGGAHRYPEETIKRVGDSVERMLLELLEIPSEKLLEERERKYEKIGRGRD